MDELKKHLSENGKKRWKGVSRKERQKHMSEMAKKSWPTDPKKRKARIAKMHKKRNTNKEQ